MHIIPAVAVVLVDPPRRAVLAQLRTRCSRSPDVVMHGASPRSRGRLKQTPLPTPSHDHPLTLPSDVDAIRGSSPQQSIATSIARMAPILLEEVLTWGLFLKSSAELLLAWV